MRITHLLLGAISGLFPLAASAINETAKWCEQQWGVLAQPFESGAETDYKNALTRWKAYEPKCRGTGSYESRLAVIYLQLDELEKAKEILTAAQKLKSEYGHLIDIALLHIRFYELSKKKDVKPEDFNQLEADYEQLIKRYPSWDVGYEQLGHLKLLLGKKEEAIKYSLAAVQRSSKSWLSYRDLAIAYAVSGKHKDSLEAGDKAYKLRKILSWDPDFMSALAVSYAAMKDFKMAQTTLWLISQRKPELRNDKDFQGVVSYVRKKMADAGVSPEDFTVK